VTTHLCRRHEKGRVGVLENSNVVSEKRFGWTALTVAIGAAVGLTAIALNVHTILGWWQPDLTVTARETTQILDPRGVDALDFLADLKRGHFSSDLAEVLINRGAIEPVNKFSDRLAHWIVVVKPENHNSNTAKDQQDAVNLVKGWIEEYFQQGTARIGAYEISNDVTAKLESLIPEMPDLRAAKEETVTHVKVENTTNRTFKNVRLRVVNASFFSIQKNDQDERRLKQFEEISLEDLRPSDAVRIRAWQGTHLSAASPPVVVTSDDGAAKVNFTTDDPLKDYLFHHSGFPWSDLIPGFLMGFLAGALVVGWIAMRHLEGVFRSPQSKA